MAYSKDCYEVGRAQIKFDEILSMILQDIKETKRYGRTVGLSFGRTDNVITVYPPTNIVCGGYKKPFSTSIFEVLSNLYRLSLSYIAGCKRCALKGEKREKEKKKRKEKEKGGKNWDQNLFFSFFFYKSMSMFFHMRSGHFSNI